jgi:hypothetical protein
VFDVVGSGVGFGALFIAAGDGDQAVALRCTQRRDDGLVDVGGAEETPAESMFGGHEED